METPTFTSEERRELTLLLLYLNAWDENAKREFGESPVLRTWTGHDFDDMDALREQELITGRKGNKSVYLTDKGVAKAKALLKKYKP